MQTISQPATAPTFDRLGVHLSPDYLRTLPQIKASEYSKAGLYQVADTSMAPNLMPGQTMAVVLLERADYLTATGVVVVTLRSQPGKYFVGRVVATTGSTLDLSRDNGQWPGLSLERSDITSLCVVRYCIDKPALS